LAEEIAESKVKGFYQMIEAFFALFTALIEV